MNRESFTKGLAQYLANQCRENIANDAACPLMHDEINDCPFTTMCGDIIEQTWIPILEVSNTCNLQNICKFYKRSEENNDREKLSRDV